MNWIRAFLEAPNAKAPIGPDYEQLYHQVIGYAEGRAEFAFSSQSKAAFLEVANYARVMLMEKLD